MGIDSYDFQLVERPLRLRSNLQLLSKYVGDNTGHARTILIKGSEESGKTELARTYIARNLPPRTDVEWVDLENEPDPLQAIDSVILRFREASSQNRLIVVLDGAEGLYPDNLDLILTRLFNWKRVSTIIVTTRNAEIKVRGAKEIHTTFFEPTGPFNPPRKKLYGLPGQTPKQKIIELVAPQIITTNESLILLLKKRPSDLHKITPRQFEQVIADLLIDMGMTVELTPATRDGGKDILAYMDTPVGKLLTLVEAKQYNQNRPVGVSLVRNLFGTVMDHQATNGMLVTTSRFAKPAQEFQERHKYELSLKDYNDVVSWILKHKAR